MPGVDSEQIPEIPDDARPLRIPRWGASDSGQERLILRALRERAWAPGVRCVKRELGNETFLGDLKIQEDRLAVVVKRFIRPAGPRGGVHALFGADKARRQCIGAWRVHQIGMITSSPLLLLRGRAQGNVADWLVMRQAPGEDLIHVLAAKTLGVREEHETARRLGQMVRRLDRAGLFNRDGKLSNLIRMPDGRIAVIDTVGVRRGKGRRLRMLASMLYEAMGTGLTPRRSLLMRCLRESGVEPGRAWRELERLAEQAGDTTPRFDPRPRSDRAADA